MTKPAVLARASEIVQPALRKAVATLDPHLRTPAEYHFGWVEPNGTPVSGGSGKGVRPALAVLGAEAAGGTAETAVPGAVALELIHNFSLIHDDIMDGDRTRRHRRTVWDIYGIGDAIIIGDSMHTLAFQILLDEAGPLHLEAARRLGLATSAMIAGQAQDSALDRRMDVGLRDCLAMEANKTGALLAHSVAIGAVLAGADEQVASALERYGSHLGLSFQAIDDVLGIWGDPEVTGKPASSDLREGKKSMPVAMALEAGGTLADEIRVAFATDNITEATIDQLAGRLESAGFREQVHALARTHLELALASLHECALTSDATAELEELARFVVDRKF